MSLSLREQLHISSAASMEETSRICSEYYTIYKTIYETSRDPLVRKMAQERIHALEEAAAAAKESGADAVVICSTDATYPEIVPALAPKLHGVLPEATVFLAGAAPADLLDTYNKAGIDEYISVRANWARQAYPSAPCWI